MYWTWKTLRQVPFSFHPQSPTSPGTTLTELCGTAALIHRLDMEHYYTMLIPKVYNVCGYTYIHTVAAELLEGAARGHTDSVGHTQNAPERATDMYTGRPKRQSQRRETSHPVMTIRRRSIRVVQNLKRLF